MKEIEHNWEAEAKSLSSRLVSAFHRLGLTDQESEDFDMAMRAIAEAREILIPKGRATTT